jgi:hypothetical protein
MVCIQNSPPALPYLLSCLASFISFSNFGSDTMNQIEVFAENNINVERTLRFLNYLVKK